MHMAYLDGVAAFDCKRWVSCNAIDVFADNTLIDNVFHVWHGNRGTALPCTRRRGGELFVCFMAVVEQTV